MSAVVFEFPVRDKSNAKPVSADALSAEIVIFPGVRHERLVDSAEPAETDTPRSTRTKKTS
jgi:hypothetical protein